MDKISGKKNLKRSIFSCTTCHVSEANQSKTKRSWRRPNICIGNVVAVLALLYIVITQITQVKN